MIARLGADIFPEIGSKPIGELKRRDVIAALRKIEARGATEIAKRMKAVCSQIFSYAIQCGLVERNLVVDMKDVLKTRRASHFAAIDADEMPTFLAALERNEARIFRPTRIALRLMLLIFVRTSELIETPWSEIDLEKGEWIIPWQPMKRGKLTVNPDTTNHHVCLSRQATQTGLSACRGQSTKILKFDKAFEIFWRQIDGLAGRTGIMVQRMAHHKKCVIFGFD